MFLLVSGRCEGNIEGGSVELDDRNALSLAESNEGKCCSGLLFYLFV